MSEPGPTRINSLERRARLVLPDEAEGLQVVASVSGGKDSTALILAMREAGIPARYVFADTGWEAPETYAYLDTLRSILGITIDVVGVEGGMVAKVRHRAGFPARMQRWCTQELKIEPLRAYHDAIVAAGVDTVSAVGIRAAESESRSKMAELDDDAEWGGFVWRPLMRWTIEDVLAIHHRHQVPVNPLYRRGHDRVGCFPCIYSNKGDIRLVADHAPERIDEIEALEHEMDALRVERNEAHAIEQFAKDCAALARGKAIKDPRPRYAHAVASFFMTRYGIEPMQIREVVEWSRTERGGRQYALPIFADAPTGGCMRWGLCDMPAETSAADDLEDAEREAEDDA